MIKALLVLLSLQSQAAVKQVLVAGPQLSDSSYNEILEERRDLVSPMEVAMQEHLTSRVRPELFHAADMCLVDNNCPGFKDHFAGLRERHILNHKELSLLNELYIKAKRNPDCFWKTLVKDNSQECSLKKLDLNQIGLGNEDSFLIIVDGRAFQKGQSVLLMPKKKYHWKIHSNRYLPKEAWATIEEIENQVSLNTPYVLGGCLASNSHHETPTENLWVAFDKSCVKKVESRQYASGPAVTQASWLSENKKWVIPVLLVFAGSAYYMRDKEIELQNPF